MLPIVHSGLHGLTDMRYAPAMTRKTLWPDVAQAKFPKNTFARIAAVLEPEEDRTDFFRISVARELKRRENAARSENPE